MSTSSPATPLSDDAIARLAGTPLLVMLDIDGTLAPIAPRPELAVVPQETRRVVAGLAARAGTHVALVTGRAAADGRRMVAVGRAWVIGNHGIEIVSPDGETEVDPAVEPWRQALARASRQAASAVSPIRGVVFEDKTWSLSVHYRLADPSVGPRLRATVDEIAERHGLVVTSGKMIVELRAPVRVDKGTAVLSLAKRLGAIGEGASLAFIGDDVTDEDAFRLLRARVPHAVTVRVTEEPDAPTVAEFSVRDPAAVRDFLEKLLRRDD
jgi:trehalose-phosphatase